MKRLLSTLVFTIILLASYTFQLMVEGEIMDCVYVNYEVLCWEAA